MHSRRLRGVEAIFVSTFALAWIGCYPTSNETGSSVPVASAPSAPGIDEPSPAAYEEASPVAIETAKRESDDLIALSADEFAAAFEEDEVAANLRFIGKEIQLTGKLENIGVYSFGPGFIYLGGIKWRTLEERPWEAALPGQTVTVMQRFPSVDMRITAVSDDRLTLAADDLAAELRTDAKAAQAKYGGRWLEIRGIIQRTEKLESESLAIYLVESDDAIIRCRVDSEREAFFQGLAPGDEVRMAGEYSEFSTDAEAAILGCFGIKAESSLPTVNAAP